MLVSEGPSFWQLSVKSIVGGNTMPWPLSSWLRDQNPSVGSLLMMSSSRLSVHGFRVVAWVTEAGYPWTVQTKNSGVSPFHLGGGLRIQALKVAHGVFPGATWCMVSGRLPGLRSVITPDCVDQSFGVSPFPLSCHPRCPPGPYWCMVFPGGWPGDRDVVRLDGGHQTSRYGRGAG